MTFEVYAPIFITLAAAVLLVILRLTHTSLSKANTAIDTLQPILLQLVEALAPGSGKAFAIDLPDAIQSVAGQLCKDGSCGSCVKKEGDQDPPEPTK